MVEIRGFMELSGIQPFSDHEDAEAWLCLVISSILHHVFRRNGYFLRTLTLDVERIWLGFALAYFSNDPLLRSYTLNKHSPLISSACVLS